MATKAAREASASVGGAAAQEASSARELANHLAPPKQAYTTKLLAEDRLSRLPFPAQLEQGLIDKLNQETVEAKIQQWQPLLYVDLTSKDALSIWLHPYTVGGRFGKEEASLLHGDEPEDSLARLGAVLRNATESQKFFRSSTQRSAAW